VTPKPATVSARMRERKEASNIKTDILYDEGLICDAWLDYVQYTMALHPVIQTRQGFVTELVMDIYARIEKGTDIPQDPNEENRTHGARGIATPSRTAFLHGLRLITDEVASYAYAIWETFKENFHAQAQLQFYFTIPAAASTIIGVGSKRKEDEYISDSERKDEATAIDMQIAYVYRIHSDFSEDSQLYPLGSTPFHIPSCAK